VLPQRLLLLLSQRLLLLLRLVCSVVLWLPHMLLLLPLLLPSGTQVQWALIWPWLLLLLGLVFW
jgi:hypothetical protein